MPVASRKDNDGIAFLLAAEVVYAVIAKDCSSPQTAEINADSRAATLMKWVNVGVVEAIFIVGVAMAIEPQYGWAFLAGGGLAAGITYGEYVHAKAAGLASAAPGTEGQS